MLMTPPLLRSRRPHSLLLGLSSLSASLHSVLVLSSHLHHHLLVLEGRHLFLLVHAVVVVLRNVDVLFLLVVHFVLRLIVRHSVGILGLGVVGHRLVVLVGLVAMEGRRLVFLIVIYHQLLFLSVLLVCVLLMLEPKVIIAVFLVEIQLMGSNLV